MSTQLFDIIKNSTYRQLQLVLESGVDINCWNERHETPLMSAMINIHEPKRRQHVVQMLLDCGADVNARNIRGQTPFMYACILSQLDTLETLLKCDSMNCDMQDFEGNTALMYACALGNAECVTAVTDAKRNDLIALNVHAVNSEGATALEYARDLMYDDIAAKISSVSEGETGYETVEGDTEASVSSCHRDNMPKREAKSGVRIKELADTIEHEVTVRDATTSDMNVVVWKEADHRKPKVAFESDSANSSPRLNNNTHQNNTEDKLIPKQKSSLYIHLPSATDTTVDDFWAVAEESANEVRNIVEKTTAIANEAASCSYEPVARKRKPKRRRNRKMVSVQGKGPVDVTETDELLSSKGFGDEFIFCNKIYGSDLWPCIGEDRDMISMYKNFPRVKRQSPEGSLRQMEAALTVKTGRLDFMKMDVRDRARILSRSIWSVYNNPLPPIPITEETLDRVMQGIVNLRRYLNKAKSKYQPGRLLSLDPELWCIIESIRQQDEVKM